MPYASHPPITFSLIGPNILIGDCRKLHNEELHNLYALPNIIRMIKPRRMRWAGHVARMGETTRKTKM
jgi:hypothetical protein